MYGDGTLSDFWAGALEDAFQEERLDHVIEDLGYRERYLLGSRLRDSLDTRYKYKIPDYDDDDNLDAYSDYVRNRISESFDEGTMVGASNADYRHEQEMNVQKNEYEAKLREAKQQIAAKQREIDAFVAEARLRLGAKDVWISDSGNVVYRR